MSFTIDVHHHILPDFFWRETNEGAHPVGGFAPPLWDQGIRPACCRSWTMLASMRQ
jgi:hypothetical protein